MAGLGFSPESPKFSDSDFDNDETLKTLKLQSSEGDIFEVELKAACMSKLIEGMTEDGDIAEAIPLCNVNTTSLSKIIEYWKHYNGKPPQPVPKPLKSSILSECGVNEWDCRYVNVEVDMIFELIKAANYLDDQSLLSLLCVKVASMIKGRSVEEIREQFKISTEDLTSEETALLSADSSLPVEDPQRQTERDGTGSRADSRSRSNTTEFQVLVEKHTKDIERAIDIPEGFKTMEIPASYRSFVINTSKWQASFKAQVTAEALHAMSNIDPRMTLKMSYRNFQQADKDRDGALNQEHFLEFSRMEHRHFCELAGLEVPFHEELYIEGFACQQFEGRSGVTFTDLQIASHLTLRILKQQTRAS